MTLISSTDNAQHVCILGVGNPEDNILSQDSTDDEEGPSSLAASNTTRDTQKKRNSTSASRSYYSSDSRTIRQNTGDLILKYHYPDNSSSKDN